MSTFVGKIEGYSIFEVTKGFLKKKDYFNEILEKDSTLEEKIQITLNNKGVIFGLKKDKKLKAVYIFERLNEDKKRILKFKESILLDEITKEIQEEFEKDILNIFKELVSLEDYEKIEWNENIIVPKTLKVGKYNIPLGSLLFILCVIIGAITDTLILGVCIGLCLSYGAAAIVNKKDANKDDKK